jgi:hypothetical protein
MVKFNPEGVRAVEDASKTTQSILITLSSYMGVVFDLADAWGDKPSAQRLSFLDWLADENHPRRTLILQNSGRFASLSRAYIGGILAMLSSRINSPDFEDSKTRRIWFFLDEFPQLGKIENFAPLLEVGRSKGVRVVIGAQDMAQIRKLYGRDEAHAWASMVGTQIFARINPGETADWVAKLVGDRIVERPNLSVSGTPGDSGQNVTRSYSRESIPVLLPSQLSDELGSGRAGVKCLLLGYRNANILLWQYTTLPSLRPVSRLASWVLGERERRMPGTSETTETAVDAREPRPPVATSAQFVQGEIPEPQDEPATAVPLLAEAPAADEQTTTAMAASTEQAPALAGLQNLIEGESDTDTPTPTRVTASANKRRIVRKKSADAKRESD